jgi:group I intron endonuclease
MDMYGYIYKIENIITNKIYIGQTTQNFKTRKSHHLYHLNNNIHHNTYLQRAFNKYGESNFKFTILNWANNRKELNNIEVYYIKKYDSLNRNKGYNLQYGGNNGKSSEETKLKMSKNNAKYWLGKKRSKETCEKISKGHRGKKLSNEHRKMLREIKPMLGKHHSPESRKKISENNARYWLGKKIPKKSVMMVSIARRGKGLFGFTGVIFHKNHNPEKKCWQSKIQYNNHNTSLGYYQDPLSGEIVYNLIFNELYDI